MTFGYDYINEPDASAGLDDWSFHQDLTDYFLTFLEQRSKTGKKEYGNNTISEELWERGVINTHVGDTFDSEYSCIYVYFKSLFAARAFIDRLNAQPEIKNFVPINRNIVVISEPDWNRLSNFLKATLTTEQYDAFRALELQITVNERW